MHNRQELIGNLGSDAEIKSVGDNRKVVKLSVATSYRYLSQGEEVTHTEWFKVEVFCTDRQGDYFAKNFLSGALVYADGRTHTEFFGGEGGKDHKSTVVKCNSVENVKLLKPAAQRSPQPNEARSAPAKPAVAASRPAQHEAPPATNRTDLMSFD